MSWWNPLSWFSRKNKTPRLYESQRGGYPVHIVDDYYSLLDGTVWDVLIDGVWVLCSSITDPRILNQINGVEDDGPGPVDEDEDDGDIDESDEDDEQEEEGEPVDPGIGGIPVPALSDDDTPEVVDAVVQVIALEDNTSPDPVVDPSPVTDPTPVEPSPTAQPSDETPNYTGCSGGSCWSSSNPPEVSTSIGESPTYGDGGNYGSSQSSSSYDLPPETPVYDTTPSTDDPSYVEPAPSYSPDPDPTPSYTPDPDPTPSYDPPADCGGSCDCGGSSSDTSSDNQS